MAKIISVVSGKGGTGKSTVSAGLGLSLAKMQYSVLMVDLDIGLRSLDILLGLENKIVFDIGDIIENKCKMSDAITKHKTYSALCLLCAPMSITKSFTVSKVIELIDSLKKEYDYIILDLPAGLGLSVIVAEALTDLLCIVTSPDVVTLRDSRKICDVLSQNSDQECKVIINRVSKTALKTSDVKDLDEVMDMVGAPLLGVVREDQWIVSNLGLTNNPKKATNEMQKTFHAIAKRITGEYVPLVVTTV
ncbi:P-loop NTPase [Paludicola sp. MB14-C6]|uniref:P-loop NTPase n=1 Tax=Paludihabitans sp. MB14-C6 TaxID=3070656 RepID=UPI0027DBC863|nr:P-loop NTPase [Paludicola sp. MB14-C6]WMJ21861.1 P-loop NTPase [Paludicola sp. MB14-C6]